MPCRFDGFSHICANIRLFEQAVVRLRAVTRSVLRPPENGEHSVMGNAVSAVIPGLSPVALKAVLVNVSRFARRRTFTSPLRSVPSATVLRKIAFAAADPFVGDGV